MLSSIPSRYWNCCWKLVNNYFDHIICFVLESNHLILPCSAQKIFSTLLLFPGRLRHKPGRKHWGGYTCRLARTWAARVKPSSWALCRAVRSLDYPTVASSHPLKPKPDLQLIHTNRVLCWVLYFRVWGKRMRLAVSGLCQPSGIMGSRERGGALLRFGLCVCFPQCKCIRVALTLLPTSDIISINKYAKLCNITK